MLEMLFPEAPYEMGIDRPLRIDSQGLVNLPEGPGLGAVPDWSYIEAHRVGVSQTVTFESPS